MAQFDAAVVSMPWYPCHDAQTPVCWSAPNVMYMTMPPQNTFVANPHALSLADAIPLSQEHTNVRVTEEATTGLRSSVGMRQPRTGCRAEARRRRDVPNCRRRETQHDSLQGSATQPHHQRVTRWSMMHQGQSRCGRISVSLMECRVDASSLCARSNDLAWDPPTLSRRTLAPTEMWRMCLSLTHLCFLDAKPTSGG